MMIGSKVIDEKFCLVRKPKFLKKIIVTRDQLQCDDSVMINAVHGQRDKYEIGITSL